MDASDIVAIIIAGVAFVVAALQALQQEQTFEFLEFRFVVTYATPAFVVAEPTNKIGPVEGKALHILDGSSPSRQATNSLKPMAIVKRRPWYRYTRVPATDDAQASWVKLLLAIQSFEETSRAWDEKQRHVAPPKGNEGQQNHVASSTANKPDHVEHQLCIQIQKVDRNWDFMSDAVGRPYATSTISGIAVLAVMLGLSWRIFKPETGELLAQSDDMTCTGVLLPGVGIAVTFTVAKPAIEVSSHSARIIPSQHIRSMLFGSVPTILQYRDRHRTSNDAPRKTLSLIFGHRAGDGAAGKEILPYVNAVDMMRRLIRECQDFETRVQWITFEIIAMLADVIRERGSNFSRLPNPTMMPWVPIFSPLPLIRSFQHYLEEYVGPKRRLSEGAGGPSNELTAQLELINAACNEHFRYASYELGNHVDLAIRETAHDELEKCDSFLQKIPPSAVCRVVAEHVNVLKGGLLESEKILTLSPVPFLGDRRMEIYFEHVLPAIIEEFGKPEYSAGRKVERIIVLAGGQPLPQRPTTVDIWVTLQYRACLWWLLHDFDPNAQAALPSQWKDSKMPVIIL